MSNNIIKFRNLNNWTQKIGITTSYLGMLEVDIRSPSLKIAYKIAQLFNVSIEEFFLEIKTPKWCISILSQERRRKYMAKQPTKAANNVYCIARKKAAEFNSKFSSSEGASEFLGISKDSLTDYDLDLCKVVPVDKVVIMAEAYNAPELLNHYCCNECPIGKRITPIIESENTDNLYRFAISVANTLDDSVNIQKTLLKIVEDGVIDVSEREELEVIVKFFSKLEKRAAEMRLIAEKYLGED